jgi:cell fate (sporulation/competence/biofilm development) regulator YlbF (YheA/YmcA/DUF963 family)
MSVIEKAKELGQEIRKTEAFQELERVTANIEGDTEASQMIKDIQELQQQIQFAQQSGVQPSQEQIDQFNGIKDKMETNLTIQAYAKAQNEFNQFMQDINTAIGAGINPDNNDSK